MKAQDDGSERAARARRAPDRDRAAAVPASELSAGNIVSPTGVLQLQRIVGNAAVARVLGGEPSPVLDVVGRGGGRPVDDVVRRQMEGAFGQDFSDVRIHAGPEASRSAASVQASAYTVGSDIVFGDSEYSPGSAEGKRLLAHELTHVVQQRQGPVDGTRRADGIAVSSPSDRFERAATANADRVMAQLAETGGVARHGRVARESAGVEAVAQRAGSLVTVQRNEESAALLKTLATPKIGEGQAIDVQTDLVNQLEKLVGEKTWSYEPSELNLGGILVDRLPNAHKTYKTTATDKQDRKADIQVLYDQLVEGGGEGAAAPAAQFVGLTGNIKGARSSGVAFGAEVKSAGLGSKVVENTLKTMIDAEQFEYLRLAGLPNDEWKILVEVHYIRARPKDMAGFHKDTQGQSLFVNLNYHVPGKQVRGPEYVLNPPSSEAHDKLIYGTGDTPGTLPEEFTEDLTKTREALGKPTKIESSGTVEPLGYVAFVDEAVHHATPWFGNRYVTPSEFKAYLERNHKAKLDEIVKADKDYRGSHWPSSIYSFSTYVNKNLIGEGEVEKWKQWLAMLSESDTSKRRRETRYTRQDFAATMQAGEFDRMLEDVGSQKGAERAQAGAGGWYAASIPNAGLSPIRPKDKPPLVRTASNADLTKNWPAQLPEKVDRRFLRCWVRAVPTSFADSVRGS